MCLPWARRVTGAIGKSWSGVPQGSPLGGRSRSRTPVVILGNVSSFYPPGVSSGKNSKTSAGPPAEFFPLGNKTSYRACCLKLGSPPSPEIRRRAVSDGSDLVVTMYSSGLSPGSYHPIRVLPWGVSSLVRRKRGHRVLRRPLQPWSTCEGPFVALPGVMGSTGVHLVAGLGARRVVVWDGVHAFGHV